MAEDERLEKLKEILEFQSTDGNWNKSPYEHGLANGLLIAMAVMTGESYPLLDAGNKYLSDIDVSKIKIPDSILKNLEGRNSGD